MPDPDLSVDNSSDISNKINLENKCNIKTLEPYERSNKVKKPKKLNPMLIHFDSIFRNNWSRYLILKTQRKVSRLQMENFLLTRQSTKDMS